MVIKCLAMVGLLTVAIILALIISALTERFNKWRKRECKIRLLCKHTWSVDWIYESGKADLVCKRCKKKKSVFIDKDSFIGWF